MNYIMLSTVRHIFGLPVQPHAVADTVARYSPTAILPNDWPTYPVARMNPPNPFLHGPEFLPMRMARKFVEEFGGSDTP